MFTNHLQEGLIKIIGWFHSNGMKDYADVDKNMDNIFQKVIFMYLSSLDEKLWRIIKRLKKEVESGQ